METREALLRRLRSAAFVAAENGLTVGDIINEVLAGIDEAEAARPKAAEAFAEYQRSRRAA